MARARALRLELPDAEIARAYRAGDTIGALARRYGVKAETISTRLRRQGVEIRPKHRDLPMDKIAADYLAGDSLKILAERYGSSRATLHERLTRAGVPVRALSEAVSQSNTRAVRVPRALVAAIDEAALRTGVTDSAGRAEREVMVRILLTEALAARGL